MLLSTLPSAAIAADLREAVIACRDVQSSADRLACYDAAIDRSRGSPQSPSAAPADQAVGAEQAGASASPEPVTTHPDIDPEALFGKNADEIEQRLEQIAGAERLEQIEARVTRIWTIAPGKVAVKLDNGQVWRQTVGSRLRLSEGDDIVIRRASLGSFMLKKAGSATMMRVARAD